MAPGSQGARLGPGMPGALGRPPGRRRRGCRRPPRTWRTARNRRPATRRPHQADPARSRRGHPLRPALRTGTSRSAVRGRSPRAGTARAVPPGAAARPGWPRTTPARPQRGEGTPRQGTCRYAGAGAQVRSAPRRCQRRGRARRAGHDGQSWRLRESAASWRAYRDGRPEPPAVGAAFCSRRPASRPCNTVKRSLVTLGRYLPSCATRGNRRSARIRRPGVLLALSRISGALVTPPGRGRPGGRGLGGRRRTPTRRAPRRARGEVCRRTRSRQCPGRGRCRRRTRRSRRSDRQS